ILQTEQLPQRVQERMPVPRGTLVCLLGQRTNRTVQDAVLEEAECSVYVCLLLGSKAAVELVKELLHDLPALGLAVLRQQSNDRTVSPARPLLLETPCLLLHDRLRRGHVLAA